MAFVTHSFIHGFVLPRQLIDPLTLPAGTVPGPGDSGGFLMLQVAMKVWALHWSTAVPSTGLQCRAQTVMATNSCEVLLARWHRVPRQLCSLPAMIQGEVEAAQFALE